ncbi:MAG: Na+/H+ antiporter NhaC family protein, partial [Planctomycetota bacterium]
ATVGIALLGIGRAMGIHEGVIGGAIISGAYFGDKISPLSDTTNLAAAMAGTNLITHIRYMLWTTVPSFLIAIGIFLTMGYSMEIEPVVGGTEALKQSIFDQFNLSPIVFVVPVGVLLMVFLRVDAIVALFVGAIAGALLAIAIQPKAIDAVAGLEPVAVIDVEGKETGEMRERSYAEKSYVAFINSMALSTQIIRSERVKELSNFEEQLGGDSLTEIQQQKLNGIRAEIAASKLLVGKGMAGMLNTIWLIITAMCFGGMMEACGLLQRITQPLVNLATSNGSLVTTTAGSCLFVNTTASDQYLSIVVPGRMFRETYRKRGLAPENLSRTLEDAGTVTSVLIPWNTCGAAQRGVLGVEVLAFAPYCFFNYISPLMTILFAWSGIGIAKLEKDNS